MMHEKQLKLPPNPRLRRNFEVLFEPAEPSLTEAFTVIKNHLVSVDMGTELISGQLLEHRTQKLVLWLVDEAYGSLMRAIRTIQQHSFDSSFIFYVTLHSGTNISLAEAFCPIEVFAFAGCRLDALQHSVLSYEAVDETVPNRANSMKLLQVVFESMGHTFCKENDLAGED